MLNGTYMKIIFKLLILVTGLVFSQNSDQINQAKAMLKQSGLTKAEAIEIAKEKGYKDSQIENVISKSKSENKKIKKENDFIVEDTSQEQIKKIDENDFLETEKIKTEDLSKDLSSDYENKDNHSKDQLGNIKYFGYDIFKGDPALFQSSSVGAVDPKYGIGPGDEIIIMIWGETQFRQVLKVDREGFIFIPDIGQVFVNGLNLNLLEAKLFRVFSQSFASLSPQSGNSTTFLDVSIGKLRPLRIQVLGEVNQPGAYTISPSATLFSSLYYFKGPTNFGSLRDIHLIRNGDKIGSIDFYDYLLTGKKLKDYKLQLDDIVFIPPRGKTITITGEINREGIYELNKKESLIDLISISGGLKNTAYLNRAQIDRIVPFEDRETLGMDKMYIDIDISDIINSKNNFVLQDGDVLKIFSVNGEKDNAVQLKGAVNRPGRYEIRNSTRLSDLIKKAEGLKGDAYLERVDIVRTNSDFSEKLIKLNIEKVLSGDAKHNIPLKRLDKIRVYSINEMIEKNSVSISGHVKHPGNFSLKEGMTLYDLIFISGGFIDSIHINKTYLERAELVRYNNADKMKKIIPFNLDLILNKKDIYKMPLKPNDHVIIYSRDEIIGGNQSVFISGNVKKPGEYEFLGSNMKLSDLIFKSGGFNDPLFKSSTYLDRADLIRFEKDRITKIIIPFNLGEVLSDLSSKENQKLSPGDKVVIYSNEVFNSVRIVEIDGVIRNPGRYNLKNKMNLKDLILEAGGLSENIFKYKIEVARINPDNKTEDFYAELINFEMLNNFNILDDNYNFELDSNRLFLNEENFILKPFDQVFIRPDPYFQKQRTIKVLGQVFYPGKYVLNNPYETLSDLIYRAGGLKSNSYPFGSSLTRNGNKIKIDFDKVMKKPNSKIDIIVQDGDLIEIMSNPKVIMILGEVQAPGLYQFIAGRRINDIIKQAGGFTQYAEKNDIFITYANGVSSKYDRLWNNKKVLDGSTITVGKEEETEPLDITEYAKEVTSILVNFAQVLVILNLAS